MFGLKFNLPFVLRVIYNLPILRLIPGLSVLVPLDAILKIVEAVQIGMEHPIIVDWKISNVNGLVKFLTELMEAAVYKGEKEQLEAIYALLVYLTTLENFMTMEEFVEKATKGLVSYKKASGQDLLPAANVFPDEEMKKACELSALPA